MNKKQIRGLFLLVALCINFTFGSCNVQETGNLLESSIPASSLVDTSEGSSIFIFPISREKVGFSPVLPIRELDISLVNPDILEVVALQKALTKKRDSKLIPDIYYQRGIEVSPEPEREYIAISTRWKEHVIGNITMSSTQEDVLSLLGEPSRTFLNKNYLGKNAFYQTWEYITEKYYISFQWLNDSYNEMQYVLFYTMPPPFDPKNKDILYTIIEDCINYPDMYDDNAWSKNWLSSDYLSYEGVAYDGSVNAYSSDGIHVQSFSGIDIYVYANFTGNLYQVEYSDKKIKIHYVNSYEPVERRWYTASNIPETYFTYLFFYSNHQTEHDPIFYPYSSTDGRYLMQYVSVNYYIKYFLIYDTSGTRNPYFVSVYESDEDAYGWVEGTHQLWFTRGHGDNVGYYVIDATTSSAKPEPMPDDVFAKEILLPISTS